MKYFEYSYVIPIDGILDFLCGFDDQDDEYIDNLPSCHESSGEEVLDRRCFYGIPRSDFKQLCEMVNININYKWLEEKYYFTRIEQGDVLVFLSSYNECEFIMLDLFCGLTDQNDMVKLGVRCTNENNNEIKKLMFNIYENAYPKSDFIESKNNELLFTIQKDNYPKKINVSTCSNQGWIYEQKIEFY